LIFTKFGLPPAKAASGFCYNTDCDLNFNSSSTTFQDINPKSINHFHFDAQNTSGTHLQVHAVLMY